MRFAKGLLSNSYKENHENNRPNVRFGFKYADGVEAGTHPEGTSAWFLPSAGQWKKIVDAIVLPEGAYGWQCFTMLRELAGLRVEENLIYWASTEYVHDNGDCSGAWYYCPDDSGVIYHESKYGSGFKNGYVRSALAF